MTYISTQIEKLLALLNEGLEERRQVLGLALLALFSGESLFLLGPPGVAKSLVARRLKYVFENGVFFEYLMSRFSTPDELFGPVSISKLKNEDKYEHIIQDYLPTAHVAFLDEIWKAGPGIQNTLLTIINEKIFRNGTQIVHVPLRLLVAASNELPASGEGLEALWDRFLIRCIVEGIQDDYAFERMMLSTNIQEPIIADNLKITDSRYLEITGEISKVPILQSVFCVIHSLREQIQTFNNDKGKVILYVSDRRWKKIGKILRTSAYLNGRDRVAFSDCLLLSYLLWDTPDQIELLNDMIIHAIEVGLWKYIFGIEDGIDKVLEKLIEEYKSAESLAELTDSHVMIVASCYYQIIDYPLQSKLNMFVADYRGLTTRYAQQYYVTRDKQRRPILRKYEPGVTIMVNGEKPLSVKRGKGSVIIDGKEYHFLKNQISGDLWNEGLYNLEKYGSRIYGLKEKMVTSRAYFNTFKQEICVQIDEHLFLPTDSRLVFQKIWDNMEKRISDVEFDMDQLIYSYEHRI